jgi:dTDP-glucose 4,6-dehydratase
MKSVVITGCLGFIGMQVTKACLDKGWRVYGIDKLTYAANDLDDLYRFCDVNSLMNNLDIKNADICELKDIPSCDYVINIAAETHVGNSIIDSTDFIQSNINGVKNLLDIIRRKPDNVQSKPILFHFSTDEVYGDIVEGSFTEESPLNPSNPYSASKASADMLIKAWARTYGLSYLILRPANNYGPYQYPEKLIPLVVKLLQQGKKIRLHDEGEPFRSWLHAADTAQAVVKIIESGVVNEIFNVEGSFEQKNKDTVRKIVNSYFNGSHDIEYKGIENLLDLSYKREGQDIRYSIDDTKLRNLGWKPEKVFDQEIDSIVENYKNCFRW